MKVTLDTNCIYALEKNELAALWVRELISLHDAKTINLCVVAISASERKRDRTYPTNFGEFQQKIAAVGLGHVEILLPIAYPGMAFADWCYPGGGEATALERKLHEILFPEIEYDYREYHSHNGIDLRSETAESTRRNAKCDVLALLSHIRFNGDIFVTSDRNFRKIQKKGQLIALGAGEILTPQQAVLAIQEKIYREP